MIQLFVVFGSVVISTGPFAQTEAAIIGPDIIIPRQALVDIQWEIVEVESLPMYFSPFTYVWIDGQLVPKGQ